MAVKCKETPYFYINKNKIAIKLNDTSLCFLHDLGAESHISDVYFSSDDLYIIVKSKMTPILHIYN